jgi:signal transduction histidine kinase
MLRASASRFRQILLTVIAGYIALAGYFIGWSYYHAVNQAEQAALMRLQGISNALALQIDGDEHRVLMNRYADKDAIADNRQDSLYDKIHRILSKNHTANALKSPVYTVVYDVTERRYEFGVTSAEKPYFRHPYLSYPQMMMDRHHEGAVIPRYEDEFGVWLSAFSVIKNEAGQVTALVQADEPFDHFLKITRRDVLKNILLSILIFGILFACLLRVLQPILRRERRDKEALAQANVRITELDNFRKEMIANLSHDLRTPIANIMGFAETLHRKKDALRDADRERYFHIIEQEAKRMNTMIGELFDLSKLESGQIRLQKEPMQLGELAQDVLYSYREQARAKHVNLITEFQESLPLVQADVYWIDRVLQNLMSNAMKYVDEKGLIMFTLFKEAGWLHLKVCNSGIPLDPSHLLHIFDRYFKSSNRHSDSTGLGLAISKKIIELHGGKIWAEVNENITTFRFVLYLEDE